MCCCWGKKKQKKRSSRGQDSTPPPNTEESALFRAQASAVTRSTHVTETGSSSPGSFVVNSSMPTTIAPPTVGSLGKIKAIKARSKTSLHQVKIIVDDPGGCKKNLPLTGASTRKRLIEVMNSKAKLQLTKLNYDQSLLPKSSDDASVDVILDYINLKVLRNSNSKQQQQQTNQIAGLTIRTNSITTLSSDTPQKTTAKTPLTSKVASGAASNMHLKTNIIEGRLKEMNQQLNSKLAKGQGMSKIAQVPANATKLPGNAKSTNNTATANAKIEEKAVATRSDQTKDRTNGGGNASTPT